MSIINGLTTSAKVLSTSIVINEGKKEETSFSERIRVISDRCLMPFHLLRRWVGGSEVSFHTHDTGMPLQKGTEFSTLYFTHDMNAEANSVIREFVTKEIANTLSTIVVGVMLFAIAKIAKGNIINSRYAKQVEIT